MPAGGPGGASPPDGLPCSARQARGDDPIGLQAQPQPLAVFAAQRVQAGQLAHPVQAVSEAGIDGEWTVADGSVAGYRVREQLANLPAESDAIGRTSVVTGSITVATEGDGARLTAGTLTVDTTTIESDEGRRDNRLRSEGLQTDQFPTATFTVTEPVDVPATVLSGTAADITLVGELTLHGVTKSVEIPAQAQFADGAVQVAGSLTFPLSDFDITAPNVGGFIISIADEGTLEFLVVFEKA